MREEGKDKLVTTAGQNLAKSLLLGSVQLQKQTMSRRLIFSNVWHNSCELVNQSTTHSKSHCGANWMNQFDVTNITNPLWDANDSADV